jgi:hypothetical protein
LEQWAPSCAGCFHLSITFAPATETSPSPCWFKRLRARLRGRGVSLLDRFVEQGLMIRAGQQYLSLAVVRERSNPET